MAEYRALVEYGEAGSVEAFVRQLSVQRDEARRQLAEAQQQLVDYRQIAITRGDQIAERDTQIKAMQATVLQQAREVRSLKWWEFTATGGTMWASDRDKVWDEAQKRYPGQPLPAPPAAKEHKS